MQAAARGDAHAIAVVWDRYASLVRSVLRGALGPDLVVEDLLQDVFIALVKDSRGSRLTGADDELFTGEYWAGEKSISLGLADSIGDLRSTLRARFGEKVLTPVIAPSGMAFYDADRFPAWKGNLFVGGLASKHLARLALDGDRVVAEERLLADRARIRDVRVGPDGLIYVVTDEDDGQILALVPR